MTSTPEAEPSAHLMDGFAGILLTDVAAVMRRYDTDQSQQVRREIIRTLFAAIEGFAWLYREHIVEAANTMESLEPKEKIALSELSYQVTEQGTINSQQRYISMLAAFRLITRIAARISPELNIRFDTGEWNQLRKAIDVRNRISHPKKRADLEIDDQDLALAQRAFLWLLDTVMSAMEVTNATLKHYNTEFRSILADLRSGDPAILTEYRAVIARQEF